MKRSKLVKLTGALMLVAAIAMVYVSGTYAKYASSATGSDSVTVAKWDIKAGKAGEETSITGTNAMLAFNLFDTIADTTNEAETDVAAGKIAPGTQGSFEFVVKNDSEVNARYEISFATSGASVPLEFRVNGGEWTSSLSSIASTAINMNASATVKVEWRWAYTGNDAADTALGLSENKTVTVQATLNVTQVD